MHHSERPPVNPELLNSLFPRGKAGPTGRFPEGKLCDEDEGEIQIQLGSDRDYGKVVIDFGRPVAWVGFNPMQARDLAECLKKHARRAAGVIEKDPPTKYVGRSKRDVR